MRQFDLVVEVVEQSGNAGVLLDQVEGGEFRQINTIDKAERGLQTTVGEKELVRQLRQVFFETGVGYCP